MYLFVREWGHTVHLVSVFEAEGTYVKRDTYAECLFETVSEGRGKYNIGSLLHGKHNILSIEQKTFKYFIFVVLLYGVTRHLVRMYTVCIPINGNKVLFTAVYSVV